MTQDELLTMMNEVAEDAKIILTRNGNLNPVFILKTENKIEMLPLQCKNDEEKEAAAIALALYADMIKAECVIHVSEAWMSYIQPDGKIPVQNPSNDSNRREILVVAGAIPCGETMIGCAFSRNGKKITFEEELPQADFVRRQSRFFWLLWSEQTSGLPRQRWQC